MHIIHEAVIESAQQPAEASPKTTTLTEQSSSELSLADQLGVQYVQSFPFAPGVRFAGYLIKADIGPTSYGFLHGADLPPDENFVTFEARGVDARRGYDIVRSAAGVAYVIVTYASHAREHGRSHLKDHIGANPDHYAARSLILDNPWPHTQTMIDQLEIGWETPPGAPAGPATYRNPSPGIRRSEACLMRPCADRNPGQRSPLHLPVHRPQRVP